MKHSDDDRHSGDGEVGVREQNERREEVVRFLLEELPEDERLALEARLLSEAELFDEALDLEYELVDAYAAGELSAAERQRFEERYLGSSQAHGRVDFALALQALEEPRDGDGTSPPQRAQPAPGQDPERCARQLTVTAPRWRLPPYAVPLGLAAGLAAVIISGAWLWRTRITDGPPSPTAQHPAERAAEAAIAPEAAPLPGAEEAPQTPDRESRQAQVLPPPATAASPGRPPDPPASAKPAAVPTPDPHPTLLIATAQLSLLSVRAPAEPQVVTVPVSSDRVRLDLDLEGVAAAGPFRVEVRDRSDVLIWRGDDLDRIAADWGPTLPVEIPAARLLAGTYELRLLVMGDGRAVEVATVRFVVRSA